MTGILSEEELGGKHLYVHELRRGCRPCSLIICAEAAQLDG
jgi:hypothetical protein